MAKSYLTFDPDPSFHRVVRPSQSRDRMTYLDLAVRTFPNGAVTAKHVIERAKLFEEWVTSGQEDHAAQLENLASMFQNARAWAWEVAKTGELRAVFDEVSEDNPFMNNDWVENIVYPDEFEEDQ